MHSRLGCLALMTCSDAPNRDMAETIPTPLESTRIYATTPAPPPPRSPQGKVCCMRARERWSETITTPHHAHTNARTNSTHLHTSTPIPTLTPSHLTFHPHIQPHTATPSSGHSHTLLVGAALQPDLGSVAATASPPTTAPPICSAASALAHGQTPHPAGVYEAIKARSRYMHRPRTLR